MKIVILTAIIFSAVVGLAFYSGIVKISMPENFFGRADKASDGFQSVGKINILENQIPVSEKVSEKKLTKQTSSKINITSIIAPAVPAPASSTPITPITPINTISPIFPTSSTISVSSTSAVTSTPIPIAQIINIGISEILVGIDGNANYEFIELYNPNDVEVDLTGYLIKKRSSSGSESTIISNNTKAGNFKDKKIAPKSHLLLAQKDGYSGGIQPDIFYSTTLAYKNNAVVLYNADGEIIEDISWDEIGKGQSLERVFSNSVSWSRGEFKVQNIPNPQNSQF